MKEKLVKLVKKIKQKQLISNPEKCYKSRKEVLNFFRDYIKMLFETECKAKYGTGLKILTPREMFQREDNQQLLPK